MKDYWDKFDGFVVGENLFVKLTERGNEKIRDYIYSLKNQYPYYFDPAHMKSLIVCDIAWGFDLRKEYFRVTLMDHEYEASDSIIIRFGEDFVIDKRMHKNHKELEDKIRELWETEKTLISTITDLAE